MLYVGFSNMNATCNLEKLNDRFDLAMEQTKALGLVTSKPFGSFSSEDLTERARSLQLASLGLDDINHATHPACAYPTSII